MNISTGISEINLSRAGANSPAESKSYIWPKYHEGKVQKVQNNVQPERELIYFKPTRSELEKLTTQMQARETNYNSNGSINNIAPFIKPGSFFDALA